MYSEEVKHKLLEVLNAWDPHYLGDWEDVIDEFAQTRDTVDDFKAGAYSWRNSAPVDQGGGLYILENHQFQKGDERKTLFIVDLGDYRYAFSY